MTTFNQEQEATNTSKRCKFLKSTLKHFAFPNCHSSSGKLLSPIPNEELDPNSDDDHELFASAIRSKYMETKSRRNTGLSLDSFSWALSSTTGESFVLPKKMEEKENEGKETEDFLLPKKMEEKENEGKETEDFFSVGSRFSRCSSTTNMDAFLSARTNLSRCSSLNSIYFKNLWRTSIIEELRHCEGWPFGLCRKAMLLPPLPKSPAESWLWHKRKSSRMLKLPPTVLTKMH